MPVPIWAGGGGVAAFTVACLLSAPAFADETPPPQLAQGGAAAPADESESVTLPDITVVAKALNAARANIEPQLGASTYKLTNDAIQDLPGGPNTPYHVVTS